MNSAIKNFSVVSIATCIEPYIGMPNRPAKILVDNWQELTKGGSVECFGIPFPLFLPAATFPVILLTIDSGSWLK